MKKKYYSAAVALMLCVALTGCAHNEQHIPEVLSSPSAASASASAESLSTADASAESTESADISADRSEGADALGLTVPEAQESASADISSVEGVYAPETAGDSLPLGNEGRLYFDDGMSVALNGTSAYDLDSIQYITDQEDSAYYGTDGWTVAICDHARQAFAQLPDLQVGAHMYIIHADGTRTDYTMVSRYYASWSNGYITLDDGRDPWNGDTRLFLQTCINAAGTRDIITYWKPTAE